MSLIGVAWASDDLGVGARGEVQSEIAVSSSITTADEGTSVTVESDDSTSTSLDDSTSTSLDDDETTVTSVAGASSEAFDDSGEDITSTTVDDDDHDDGDASTSTTFDDDGNDDDSANAGPTAALGLHTYVVSGVGEVTIEVLSNGLGLVAVNAPDWTVAIDGTEDDKIKIDFRRGEAEAEFEAELHSSGGLSIEIEGD